MRGSLTTVQQSHCGWWTFEFYQKVCIEGRLPGIAGFGYRFQKHTLSLSRWVWCFFLAGNSSFLGLLSKISVLTKRRLTVPIITHQHLFTVVLVYPIASIKWRITNNVGFFLFAHLVFSSDNCKWITLHVLCYRICFLEDIAMVVNMELLLSTTFYCLMKCSGLSVYWVPAESWVQGSTGNVIVTVYCDAKSILLICWMHSEQVLRSKTLSQVFPGVGNPLSGLSCLLTFFLFLPSKIHLIRLVVLNRYFNLHIMHSALLTL